MEPLIIALLRALRSLLAPGMFSIFIRSVLITVAALIAFVFLTGTIFSVIASFMSDDNAWKYFLPWIGGVGSGILAWFLFPGIMPIIVNFFDIRIATIIEKHDYPTASPAAATDFWAELKHDAKFSGIAIGLNILIFPLYFLMPGLHLIPFYLLNGYLLGREFFMMVAKRYVSVGAAAAIREQHSRNIFIAGVILAIMATLPFLNLIAPFWGIAAMVHLYHQLSALPATPTIENNISRKQ
jgi:CysZ protein